MHVYLSTINFCPSSFDIQSLWTSCATMSSDVKEFSLLDS